MKKGCVLYAGYEFAQSGKAVKRYLEGKGFTVTLKDVGEDLTIEGFRTLPQQCDFSMWLSHGGWDGPMVFGEYGFSGQIDPGETPTDWNKLKSAMGLHMKKGGMLVSHSCHSAGSNKYEAADGYSTDRWVMEVARDMNLYTAGVEGSTASANHNWAVRMAQFALEGKRNLQPTRAYKPGGQRVTQWPGWLRLSN